jgi:transcriptional regulator with XRE-family HTH domain
MSEVMWMKIFGEQLERVLDYTWTSQEELAEAIGVSQSTVSRYITGKQMPSVDIVIKIALSLDYDIDALIDYDEFIY